MFGYRDYKCAKCGEVVKDVPTIDPAPACPKCKTEMDKVWTAPETIYKGSGWTPKFF